MLRHLDDGADCSIYLYRTVSLVVCSFLSTRLRAVPQHCARPSCAAAVPQHCARPSCAAAVPQHCARLSCAAAASGWRTVCGQGACKSAGNFWRPESCKLDLCASCVQVVVLYVDEATSVNRQLARQARSAEHNKKVQDALVGSLMCANFFCSFALRKRWKQPMTCTDHQLLT